MPILDTNVVSELISPRCSPAVVRTLSRFPPRDLVTTAVSEAELRLGASLLLAGRRRTELIKAIDDILEVGLGSRVLPFDRAAALAYARVNEVRRSVGRPIAVFDAMIAAICISVGTALVTRNVRDFQGCGIELIDPWVES